MKELFLFPEPQKLELTGGTLKRQLVISLPEELDFLSDALLTAAGDVFAFDFDGCTEMELDFMLPPEGYRLTVREDGIKVTGGSPAGVFYGLMTLRQLALQGEIPCLEIEDMPELKVRGFMMDISRGKVPTLDTLKKLADLLASLRYNHLELYIEGFSFAYPSFPDCLKGQTPLTPDEIRELDDYCLDRFIELVPCQNTLGHMDAWLARPEFRHLAENDAGISFGAIQMPPSTLNALDPGSLELVRKMSEDLLPCFSSSQYNVCLDEPFGIGEGKCKAYAAEHGTSALYLGYLQKLSSMVRKMNRRMLMWGDIVAKSPELIPQLPEDALYLDWGYDESYDFAEKARRLSRAGLNFCLCPGTSSWTSYTGMTDNMLKNIRNAAAAAHRFGAEGVILTDWGDQGHLQYLPASYPAMMLASALCWSSKDVGEDQLIRALDAFLYRDETGMMGAFALEAGRYYQLEELRFPSRTMAAMPLTVQAFGEMYRLTMEQTGAGFAKFLDDDRAAALLHAVKNRKPVNEAALLAFFDQTEAMLDEARPRCADAELMVAEYRAALKMLRILTKARKLMEDGIRDSALAAEIRGFLPEHYRLWLARNKAGRMEESAGGLVRLAAALRE